MRRLALLVLVPLGSSLVGAQAGVVRLTGIVTDSSGRVVPFANVAVVPAGRRVVAGTDGRFVLEVERSVREVEARRIGFTPRVLQTQAWPDTGLHIVLEALPARLERVRVEAEQQIQSLRTRGFYDRQAELEKGINHGFMITPEEIEKRKGARVTDFFYGHPAIKVVRARAAGALKGSNNRSGLQPQGQGGCRMEIYVDGNRFYTTPWPPDPRSFRSVTTDQFIDDQIAVSNVAAIEVYPRAVGAPPRYQAGNGACGVILIWTR